MNYFYLLLMLFHGINIFQSVSFLCSNTRVIILYKTQTRKSEEITELLI